MTDHGVDAQDGAHHGPPPLPEPSTPMWLPAVGALLFLSVGLAWAMSTPPKDPTETMAAPVQSAQPAPSAPPPQPAQAAPPPQPAQPTTPPSGRPGAAPPPPAGGRRPTQLNPAFKNGVPPNFVPPPAGH